MCWLYVLSTLSPILSPTLTPVYTSETLGYTTYKTASLDIPLLLGDTISHFWSQKKPFYGTLRTEKGALSCCYVSFVRHKGAPGDVRGHQNDTLSPLSNCPNCYLLLPDGRL